ncbi:ribonuclease H-like domain-containing protein [Tanacetum coccineum]
MMKSHLHHHLHKKLNKKTNTTKSSNSSQPSYSFSKKGEYDIWAMKIEHYLAHTDYPIWEVIQNGNGPVSVTLDTTGQIKILPPKTAEEMKKYILKQQFEGFTVSNSDGIHKGYERFQSLLSQLEIHGAGVSTEDANQKFLRSLPSAWLQVSLIMRNKPGMDSLSFDDLYNNLRVFENDVKGSTASSSNLQNIAFVSENTNVLMKIRTAYEVNVTMCQAVNSTGSDTQDTEESSELVFEQLFNESHIEVQPKVWSDAPIIEEYESDSDNDDENVYVKIEDLDTPSFAAKHVKTPSENVKNSSNTSQKPKEFKNRDIIEFCGLKGIKREYSNARTLQQNGVAERKNRTLIEAARTMLADSFLPNTFWACIESSSMLCYVLNRVLVTKPHNKTPYELLTGNSQIEDESARDCFEVPYWHSYSSTNTSSSKSDEKRRSPRKEEQVFLDDLARLQRQEKEANEEAEALIRNHDQDTEKAVTQAEAEKTLQLLTLLKLITEIPPLEDIHEDATDGIFTHASYDDEGAVADFTNLETIVNLWSKAMGEPIIRTFIIVCLHVFYLQHEPMKISEVLVDESWGDAMQEGIDCCLRFKVYQMDVKSAFLYGKIDEEVYVSQPPGFKNLRCSQNVYKVVQSSVWATSSSRACTPIENSEAFSQRCRSYAVEVIYIESMIGSLMFVTAASRPGHYVFSSCACSRFQVTPKTIYLTASQTESLGNIHNRRLFNFLEKDSLHGHA